MDPNYLEFDNDAGTVPDHGKDEPNPETQTQTQVDRKKATQEDQQKSSLQVGEKAEVEYDSFDSYLFYSFHAIKKWYLFTLLAPNFKAYKNPKEFFQMIKNALWDRDDSLVKKSLIALVMVPVLFILGGYTLLVSFILLLIGLICLIIFVLFVDLPFLILLAIQLTLLLLLLLYTDVPSTETMASLFLTSGIWYTELIWMILYVGLMIKEYDDIGNSVIYISSHYRNKKIPSKFLTWTYIVFSCFPQMVQFIMTSLSAWFSVRLIFMCDSYLAPFSHFSGLFVLLQVDSFIMEFIKFSKLYVPPGKVFTELENLKKDEREKQKLGIKEESSQIKVYTWDQLHFTNRTIQKFFHLKEDVSYFVYNPKLEDEQEAITHTRLIYLKYVLMTIGMTLILYNFVVYVIAVCC